MHEFQRFCHDTKTVVVWLARLAKAKLSRWGSGCLSKVGLRSSPLVWPTPLDPSWKFITTYVRIFNGIGFQFGSCQTDRARWLLAVVSGAMFLMNNVPLLSRMCDDFQAEEKIKVVARIFMLADSYMAPCWNHNNSNWWFLMWLTVDFESDWSGEFVLSVDLTVVHSCVPQLSISHHQGPLRTAFSVHNLSGNGVRVLEFWH